MARPYAAGVSPDYAAFRCTLTFTWRKTQDVGHFTIAPPGLGGARYMSTHGQLVEATT